MAPASPSSALPKFIQISEMLIREIAAGHLVDGARLPPEREMADELGVAVGTLRKALADVEAKGLLDRVQGSGNYVRAQARGEFGLCVFPAGTAERGRVAHGRGAVGGSLGQACTALRALGGDAEGHRIRRLRSLDGVQIALEEIWLDGATRDRIAVSDLSDSLYHFYRHELGLVIASVEDRIGVDVVPGLGASRLSSAPRRTGGLYRAGQPDRHQRPRRIFAHLVSMPSAPTTSLVWAKVKQHGYGKLRPDWLRHDGAANIS